MALVSCKECGEKISQKANSCPKCGYPVKKARSFKWIVGFLAINIAIGFILSSLNKHSTRSQTKPVPRAPTSRSNVSWMGEINSYCSKYEKSQNDIQASKVFKEFEEKYKPFLARFVDRVEGKLISLTTDHGGDDIYIKIQVGNNIFHDQDTNKGDKIYSLATNLVEGQCVQFSGGFRISGLAEHAIVCPSDFYGDLVNITPCGSK